MSVLKLRRRLAFSFGCRRSRRRRLGCGLTLRPRLRRCFYYEDILSFEVAVRYTLRVQKRHASCQLPEEAASFFLRQARLLRDAIEQGAASRQLQHKEEARLPALHQLAHFVQRKHVGVAQSWTAHGGNLPIQAPPLLKEGDVFGRHSRDGHTDRADQHDALTWSRNSGRRSSRHGSTRRGGAAVSKHGARKSIAIAWIRCFRRVPAPYLNAAVQVELLEANRSACPHVWRSGYQRPCIRLKQPPYVRGCKRHSASHHLRWRPCAGSSDDKASQSRLWYKTEGKWCQHFYGDMFAGSSMRRLIHNTRSTAPQECPNFIGRRRIIGAAAARSERQAG